MIVRWIADKNWQSCPINNHKEKKKRGTRKRKQSQREKIITSESNNNKSSSLSNATKGSPRNWRVLFIIWPGAGEEVCVSSSLIELNWIAKEFSFSYCSCCCWIIISWEELKRAWFSNRSSNLATVHHQPSAILSSLGELFEEVRGGGIVGVGGGIVVISGDSGGVLLDGADLANNNHRAYQKGGPLSATLLNGGKMAADAGSDTCPSPEIGDSRKRPLEGDDPWQWQH